MHKYLFVSLLFVLSCAAIPRAAAWHPPFRLVAAVPENGLGKITGKITGDLKGVCRSKVVVLQKDKVIDETETDEDGFYEFRYLQAGCYDIKATKDGFRTCIVTRIPVGPDLVTKLDFYQPRFNNEHMPEYPIVETYEYYYRLMKHPNVSFPR